MTNQPEPVDRAIRPIDEFHDEMMARAAAGRRKRLPAPRPVNQETAVPAADGLVPHGEPIDIGWIGGRLDARLTLTVHPGMDQLEREQLLADIRDALAPVVPVRRTGREVSS